MSTKPYKGFEPKWLLTPAPEGSYRSIFRWGDPNFFKYPKESLYKLMKETFKMTDEDFKEYTDDIGFDQVDLSSVPSKIDEKHIAALRRSAGARRGLPRPAHHHRRRGGAQLVVHPLSLAVRVG